jgi:hypothetical protein
MTEGAAAVKPSAADATKVALSRPQPQTGGFSPQRQARISVRSKMPSRV